MSDNRQYNQQYKNPPINEAILHIQVESVDSAIEKLEQSPDEGKYSIAEKLKSSTFQTTLGPTSAATEAREELIGNLFKSEDKTSIVQFRKDGFTYSRLKPYAGWKKFHLEARRLWGLYCKRVGEPKITRLAIRYVNQLDINKEGFSLERYLRTYPDLSSDLPGSGISAYFLQLRIPQPQMKLEVILNQGVVPPANSESISIVLDIDVIRLEDIPSNDTDLWQLIEEMHDLENKIFESSITTPTREEVFSGYIEKK